MEKDETQTIRISSVGCGFFILMVGISTALAILMVRFALSFNF